MPTLSLTKTASNGLAHDASHVNTPLTEVETWANTTKLDYLNIQDNGLRVSGLRTHANVEGVRIKVRNATGSSIAANSLVYFSGTYSDGSNNYPTITKAISTTAVGSTYFAQAVTSATIADGADGTAAIFMELSSQNTSSGTVGDLVYLDTTAGGWTRTRPTGGQYIQVVGTITVVHASTGRIVLSLGAVPEHLTGGSSGLGATFQTLTVQGASGAAADIYHFGDAGEDNADKWKISVADGGNMTWENYTSGSYAAKLTLTSAGAATTAGALNIGSVSAAGEDTDKFLVLDSGSNVDYRTGAQVLSDIGAQASGTYTTLAFKTIAVSGQDNVVADAADDTLTLAAGSNITITTTAGSDTVTIAGAAGGIASVVADTTPQLGGDLDVNGNDIVSVSNGNVNIAPNGSGTATIDSVPVVNSYGPYGTGASGSVSNITDADINGTTVAQSGTISLTSNRIIRATSTVTLSQAITVGYQSGQVRGSYPVTHGGIGIELGAILATIGSKGIPVPIRPGGGTASLCGGIVQILAAGNVVVGGTITANGTNASSDGGGGGGLVVIVSGGTISGSSAISVAAGAGHATGAAKGGAGSYSGAPGGHAGLGGSGGGGAPGATGDGGGGGGGAGYQSGQQGANGYGPGGGGGGCISQAGSLASSAGGVGGSNTFQNLRMSYVDGLTAGTAGANGSANDGGAAGANGGGGGGGGSRGSSGSAGAGGNGGSGGSGGGGGGYGGFSSGGAGGNGAAGSAVFYVPDESPYAGGPGGQGGGGSAGGGYGAGGGGAAGSVGAAGSAPAVFVASQGNGVGGAGVAGSSGQVGGSPSSHSTGGYGGAGGAGGNGGGAAGLVIMIAPSITYSGTVTGRHVKIEGTDYQDFINGLLQYG